MRQKAQKAYVEIKMPNGCRDCRLIQGDKSTGFYEAGNYYSCPLDDDGWSGWCGNDVPSTRPEKCKLKPVRIVHCRECRDTEEFIVQPINSQPFLLYKCSRNGFIHAPEYSCGKGKRRPK